MSPVILMEPFGSVDQALNFTAALDLLVIDVPPNSDTANLKIARGMLVDDHYPFRCEFLADASAPMNLKVRNFVDNSSFYE
jgi:hypothetical protein